MADNAEPITQVPDAPAAEPSAEAISAAFDNPQPYNSAPEPTQVAPVEVAPAPIEAANPAPTPDVAVVPESVAPITPDYSAYLKETFGVEAPEALKEKLTQAEAFKANQRTPQDVAFEKLMSDPVAAVQYVKLQSTDYNALSDRALHAAAYAHAHPELKPDVAQIRARREFDAEYAAAEFPDDEDPEAQEAKVLVADMRVQSLQTMEQAKTAAREAVLTKATPLAEGPTVEQQAAQQLREAHTQAWTKGVENVINAESLALAYNVDGQEVKIAFDPKNAEYQAFVQDPIGWIEKAVGYDPQNPSATNFDRVAEMGAWLTQRDVMLKNTLAVGKSSLGAVIPLNTAVNPVSAAPQAPRADLSIEEAFAQAAPRSRNTNY